MQANHRGLTRLEIGNLGRPWRYLVDDAVIRFWSSFGIDVAREKTKRALASSIRDSKRRSRLLNPPSAREVFLALEGHPTLREENWGIQETVSNVSTKIHRIRRGQLSPPLSPATNTQRSISRPILPHFSVASITFGRIECDSKNWPGGVNHGIEITLVV